MDDQTFDKFMKDKLEGYEDSHYDPEAFEQLQGRLSAYPGRTSWISRNKTIFWVAASLVLFTLLNTAITYSLVSGKSTKPVSTEKQDRSQDEVEQQQHDVSVIMVDSLKIYREHVDSLQSIIAGLRIDHQNLVNRHISDLQALNRLTNKSKLDKAGDDVQGSRYFLGYEKDIPAPVVEILKRNHLVRISQGEIYQSVTEDEYAALQNPFPRHLAVSKNFHYQDIKPQDKLHHDNDDHTRQLSSKQQQALEKHYFDGLSISVAPHVDGLQSFYQGSSGQPSLRAGISADWIFAPRWSVETSLDYVSARFTRRNNFLDIDMVAQEFNSELGSLNKVGINTSAISFGLNIKYRQWISTKNEIILKAGYTPYFGIHQNCRMTYKTKPHYGGSYTHVEGYNVEQNYRRDLGKFYGGTVGLSAGLMRTTGKRNKIESSLFFERSIGGVGPDKLQMSLLGLRLAYWYSVK
jgi:hypothetical protein